MLVCYASNANKLQAILLSHNMLVITAYHYELNSHCWEYVWGSLCPLVVKKKINKIS